MAHEERPCPTCGGFDLTVLAEIGHSQMRNGPLFCRFCSVFVLEHFLTCCVENTAQAALEVQRWASKSPPAL
jgi:hypothetical protein